MTNELSPKIAFLLQDRGEVYGAERATADLAEGLCASGQVSVEVWLVKELRMGSQGSRFEALIRERGLVVRSFPVETAFSWPLIRSLRSAVKEGGCDVLHTIGYKPNLHALFALGCRSRVALVSTVHGWLLRKDVKEQAYEWLEMRVLKRAKRVVVLSRFYEQLLLKKGVRRKRLARIPSGLSPATELKETAGVHQPVVFGMLGRFSEEKGHEWFLRAASMVTQRGVEAKFLAAGDGPTKQKAAVLTASLDLGEQVTFSGYLDHHDFFKQIDVLVLASRIENLPYSILEAMSGGLPVIASSTGGIPDLVEHEKTGLLFDVGDVEALAGCMAALAANPARVVEMGRAGRERYLAEFKLSESVARHLELYRETVSS